MYILILGIILLIISFFIFLKVSKIKIEKDKELKQKKELLDQIEYLKYQYSQWQKDTEVAQKACDQQDKKFNQLLKKNEQIRKQADKVYERERAIVQQRLEDFKKTTLNAANVYVQNIQEVYSHADAAHTQKMTRLKQEQTQAAAALNKLKETRKAAYEAILKEKEIKQNKDNYRLLPSLADLQDIHSLERIKRDLHKPRILSMLIWQTFWQPIAKKQFPIILQDKTKMGIYKITNLETDQSYIGQSVDIYKRWNQHCKAGLGIDTPVGNKLYKAIQKVGLQNFTFELLCECQKQQLDEKERYFIELYQADTFGYNSTIGNK